MEINVLDKETFTNLITNDDGINKILLSINPYITKISNKIVQRMFAQSGSNIENEDVLDIRQELLISLWKRLKHYDPEHGNPFSFIQHHMLLTSKYILNHKIKKKIKHDNAVKYAISTYKHSYNPINDLIDSMDFDKFKSSFSKREQSLIDAYVYRAQALKNFTKSERIILKRKLKFKYNL